MGTKINDIIHSKEISIEDLSGKSLAVDSFNMLYQFLSTIRQQDGSPLVDSQGRVTSHLSGLFFRISNFLKSNIKLAFVFDGESPVLKKAERERRQELKKAAQKKYELAVEQEDLELMRKYASRTTVLTKELIEESKELIRAFGIPIIDAPSEGEAQAAYMVNKGEFYAVISQDMDSLLFGSTKIVRNLSITGKRRKAGTSAYIVVNPEIIDLSENMNLLGIDNDQLIVIGMLCGTDFNIGGIKGIGPKKALDLVKRHNKDFNTLFKEAKWEEQFDFSWEEIFNLIKNMPTTDEYELVWKEIDKKKIIELLVEKHEFSLERVENSLNELTKKRAQKGLSDFF